jgi:hypothetical protein
MPMQTTSAWQAKVTSALSQDPKKTGVLSVLVLVLVIAWSRMMIGSNHPALAAGSLAMPAGATAQVLPPTPVLKPGSSAAIMREWLSAPIPPITRNDFQIKSEYFPHDTTGTAQAPAPTGFWTTLEKSLSVQADQKEKRDAQIADLKSQAAALRPTSTIMGPSPRAMVNGALVAVGDCVASFRVIKIEARGIIVERDGVRLVIPMN